MRLTFVNVPTADVGAEVVVMGGGKRGFRKKGRAFPTFAIIAGSAVPLPVRAVPCRSHKFKGGFHWPACLR